MCSRSLNKWYGFEDGGNRKSSDKICRLKENGQPKNQDELANTHGITRTTMSNYIHMASIIKRRGNKTLPHP